jgi:hypothetical protein
MKSIKVHEAWCTRQQEDYEIMMSAVDDLGAASLALASNGAQAYTHFIQARDNFKQMYRELNNNYRYVEE